MRIVQANAIHACIFAWNRPPSGSCSDAHTSVLSDMGFFTGDSIPTTSRMQLALQ